MHIEPLEPRSHLSGTILGDILTPPENINISRRVQNQSEAAIALDPTDLDRLFVLTNLEFDDALFSAMSDDAGRTWSRQIIANGADGLAAACCDPSAVFDRFGNLYITYVNAARNAIHVARSTDAGQTFSRVARFRGELDQPTLAAGPDGIWVVFEFERRIVVSAAPLDNDGDLGSFSSPRRARSPLGSNFADISIGADGQVIVAYQSPVRGQGPSNVYTNTDPDGPGPKGFRAPVRVSRTRVGGFYPIPAQRKALIDAEVGIVYDNSPGPFNGRAYLLYTNADAKRPSDTDIFLRFSDNDGLTWSRAFRVNDDNTRRSQFLPRIALDQTTGNLAFSWHDSRLDAGIRGPNSSNSTPNDDAQLWGTLASPTNDGVAFSDDFQISESTSNARRADNRIDFGDYHGLVFHDNIVHAAWADNSNSTRDNPNGRLRQLDIYTTRIPVV